MPRIEDQDDDLQDDDQGGDAGGSGWRSRLLTWGLAGAALLLGFLVPYMLYLNHQVGERFGKLRWQVPTRVYARPLTLRDGLAMDAQTLKTELDAASYHAGDGKRAGTYARNGVCAVSCTGKGENFIRLVAGHEIASRMDYLGQSLNDATDGVVFRDMKAWRIGAGLCAINARGESVVPYNTLGMYRGFVTPDGALHVGVHDDLALVETL